MGVRWIGRQAWARGDIGYRRRSRSVTRLLPMAAVDSDVAVAALERAPMDAMFTAPGRAAPSQVARDFAIPGCQYNFVRQVLGDPRFSAPSMPASGDLMFQTVARFMSRLPADRHRPLRARFSGLFSARRVERYRAGILSRTHTLID